MTAKEDFRDGRPTVVVVSLVGRRLAAVLTGWGLRFRPSPDATAWRRRAVGERRTARLLAGLERQGWAVLHDLAVPGSRANLDHLGDRPRWGVRRRFQAVSRRLKVDRRGGYGMAAIDGVPVVSGRRLPSMLRALQ